MRNFLKRLKSSKVLVIGMAVVLCFAFTGCSKEGQYAEVLAALEDADVQVYRTDQQGTITCVSDGKGLDFIVER